MSDPVGGARGTEPVDSRRDGRARLPVAQPQTALSHLRVGDIVQGVVVGPAPEGQTYVDTRHGRLAVAGLTGIPPGQAVRLEVVQAGDHLELAPVQLKLETLERGVVLPARLIALPQSPAGISTGALISVPDAPAALRALVSGAILEGTLSILDGAPVLSGPFGRISLAAQPGALTLGPARFAVVESGEHLTLALATPAAGTPATSFQSMFTRLAPYGQAPGVAPEGVPVTVRVIGRAPPGTAMEGGHGAVIGTALDSFNGIARVQVPTGTLLVPVARAPEPGTRMSLQIMVRPEAAQALTPEDLRAQSLNNLAKGWPALEESLRALTALEPKAGQALAAALPAPGPQFLSGIAAFLASLFGGSLPERLSEPRRALERHGLTALAQRLSTDAAELVRIGGEPVGEWRTAFVPILENGAHTQVRFFLHGPRRAKEDAAKPKGTRFLVEAELSRLGRLQLDGLVSEKRFDLIVRTTRPLDPAVAHDIEQICAGARAAAGWAGAQFFQVTERFPVTPLSAASGHAVGVYA